FCRLFSDPRYRVRHLPRSTPGRVSRDRRDRSNDHGASVPGLPSAGPRRGGYDVRAVPARYALTFASKPFWELDIDADSPRLPRGYQTMSLIALYPPAWHRAIDPLLADWDNRLANEV